jgi:hypothetical protein
MLAFLEGFCSMESLFTALNTGLSTSWHSLMSVTHLLSDILVTFMACEVTT